MSNELIVMPDPVAVVRAAILDRIAEVDPAYSTVPVVEMVPATKPPRFVRIVRTGGVVVDRVVRRAMLTLEAWAPNDQQSQKLAEAVSAVLFALPGSTYLGVPVYRVVEFSGPANSPDPASRTPRHVWTVEVSLRGSAV